MYIYERIAIKPLSFVYNKIKNYNIYCIMYMQNNFSYYTKITRN